jgi:hypothetical protein
MQRRNRDSELNCCPQSLGRLHRRAREECAALRETIGLFRLSVRSPAETERLSESSLNDSESIKSIEGRAAHEEIHYCPTESRCSMGHQSLPPSPDNSPPKIRRIVSPGQTCIRRSEAVHTACT